jgi:hypothetical protein
MTSCQFPRIPEQSVVVDRYIIAEKHGMISYDPLFNTMTPHIRPAQYILVIEDSTGNRYNYRANEIHFQKIQIGDSLYYNRDTETMICIK